MRRSPFYQHKVRQFQDMPFCRIMLYLLSSYELLYKITIKVEWWYLSSFTSRLLQKITFTGKVKSQTKNYRQFKTWRKQPKPNFFITLYKTSQLGTRYTMIIKKKCILGQGHQTSMLQKGINHETAVTGRFGFLRADLAFEKSHGIFKNN